MKPSTSARSALVQRPGNTVPLPPNLQFATGEQPRRQPSIDISHGLPPRATVTQILSKPGAYGGKIVTIAGCYIVDPYHGAILGDSAAWNGHRALSLLGGSDDTAGRHFDWTTQQVCGTLVGRVEWRPVTDPLRLLCGEVCFVSDQTRPPRIVDRPPRY